MNSRTLTLFVSAVGVLLPVVAILLPNVPHHSIWVGVGSVYLLTGVFLGVPRVLDREEVLSFRYAIVVTVLALVPPVVLRVWSVQTAHPTLPVPGFIFIFLQVGLLVPLVAAFMTPLGFATTQTERRISLALILSPTIAALANSLVAGTGFGLGFFSIYWLFVFASSVVIGFPLYYYASNLSTRSLQD